MSTGIGGNTDLTRNQALVMGALSSADGPLSAYAILDRLRDEGFRAPLQVYRALDKLVSSGLVHRLESLNAFVACQHPDCETHATIAFTICDDCGEVRELEDASLGRRIKAVANAGQFVLRSSVVELRGLCGACKQAA